MIEIKSTGDDGETTETTETTTTLATDHDKITWLLQYLKSVHFTEQQAAEFSIQRLGKKRDGFNRVIKIKLATVEDRDAFLANASILKDAPEAWGKVFIKKDQHPVYLQENKRLRKKM